MKLRHTTNSHLLSSTSICGFSSCSSPLEPWGTNRPLEGAGCSHHLSERKPAGQYSFESTPRKARASRNASARGLHTDFLGVETRNAKPTHTTNPLICRSILHVAANRFTYKATILPSVSQSSGNLLLGPVSYRWDPLRRTTPQEQTCLTDPITHFPVSTIFALGSFVDIAGTHPRFPLGPHQVTYLADKRAHGFTNGPTQIIFPAIRAFKLLALVCCEGLLHPVGPFFSRVQLVHV